MELRQDLRGKIDTAVKRTESAVAQKTSQRQGGRLTVGTAGGLETLAGALAALLAILGLAGVLPFYMVTLAAVAVGAGLFVEGATVTAAYGKIARDGASTAAGEKKVVGGGIGAQTIGGAVGMGLGILGLFGVVPGILVPVAAITMGAALLFGGRARPTLTWSSLQANGDDDRLKYGAADTVKGASGATGIAGASAIVLGVLTLLGVGPGLLLGLVSFLLMGTAMFLAGAATTVKPMQRSQMAARQPG